MSFLTVEIMLRMATKLIRLVNDKKKSLNANSSGTNLAANTSGKRVRDVETEELVAELNSKVSDLEMQNKRLKENVRCENVCFRFLTFT